MQDKNGTKIWPIGLLTMVGALMLTLTVAVATPLARQGPMVRIEPAQSTVMVSESFTVSVMVDDAVDLGGFQFDLAYDPSVVWVDGVTLGDFLESTERYTGTLGPRVDNEVGKVAFGGFSFGDPPGPDGSGILALVNLTAVGLGSSSLTLQDVWLTDTEANLQTPTVEDATVTVSSTTTPTPTTTPTSRVYLPLLWKSR